MTRFFLGLLLICFFSLDARAADLNFAPGTLMAGGGTSYVYGWGKRADIGSLNLSADYFLLKNFSLGGELVGYTASQPGPDTSGLNISGLIRHHILHWDAGTAYIDAAFGPIETDSRIPAGGTRFNFITRVGPGVMFRLDDNLYLLTGARYWHLSNAQIEGVHRNPAINGMQVYFQLSREW